MSNFPFATITDAKNYVCSGIWSWDSDEDCDKAAEIFYRAGSEREAVKQLAEAGLIESGDVETWMVGVQDREDAADEYSKYDSDCDDGCDDDVDDEDDDDDYSDYDSLTGQPSDDDE